MLTYWIFGVCEVNGSKWPRKQVRGGAQRNNFVLVVK